MVLRPQKLQSRVSFMRRKHIRQSLDTERLRQYLINTDGPEMKATMYFLIPHPTQFTGYSVSSCNLPCAIIRERTNTIMACVHSAVTIENEDTQYCRASEQHEFPYGSLGIQQTH